MPSNRFNSYEDLILAAQNTSSPNMREVPEKFDFDNTIGQRVKTSGIPNDPTLVTKR